MIIHKYKAFHWEPDIALTSVFHNLIYKYKTKRYIGFMRQAQYKTPESKNRKLKSRKLNVIQLLGIQNA